MGDRAVDSSTNEGVNDMSWLPIDGIDPASASFPVEVEVGGETILLLKTGEGFRACERYCPHQKVALASATLMSGGTMLRCSRHNFIFRLTDGAGVNCTGLRLKVYEVRERDGRLEVALTD